MLRRSIIILFLAASFVAAWSLLTSRPNIEDISEDARLRLPKGSELHSFKRLHDGRELTYIATVSIPESGVEFCKTNDFSAKRFIYQPLDVGEPGYEELFGKSGICYEQRQVEKNGIVLIVVRNTEVVIYVEYSA
jgi:hypothetical protein